MERWVMFGKGRKAHLLVNGSEMWAICQIGGQNKPATSDADKCKSCIREIERESRERLKSVV